MWEFERNVALIFKNVNNITWRCLTEKIILILTINYLIEELNCLTNETIRLKIIELFKKYKKKRLKSKMRALHFTTTKDTTVIPQRPVT